MSSPEPTAAGDVVDDPRGERVGVERRRRGEHAREQVDADVDAPAAPLDQAVGVGDEGGAGGERDVGLADRLGRARTPSGGAPARVEPRDGAGLAVDAAATAGARPRRSVSSLV